jgi:hypothetical protein
MGNLTVGVATRNKSKRIFASYSQGAAQDSHFRQTVLARRFGHAESLDRV